MMGRRRGLLPGRLHLPAVAAALLATACAAPPAADGDYSGRSIVLGAVVSLSGAGDIHGPQQKAAIELAVKAVNASGGVNGARVDVRVDDDGSAAERGAEIFAADIKDNVYGLIGPTLTNTAHTAHPAAQSARVPVIAPSSPEAGVVGTCTYPCDFVFRAGLGEAVAIPDNVRFAVEKKHLRSAVVFYAVDDRASVEGGLLFQQAFKDNAVVVPDGGTTTFPTAQAGFEAEVTAAVGRHPDAWAISAPAAASAAIMLEARRQGFTGQFLGGDAFNSYLTSGAAGDSGKGAQSVSGYFAGSDGAVNRAFVAAYTRANNKPPDEYAAQAYAAVLAFAEAARHAHLSFVDVAGDRVRLRDALAAVSLETPLGRLAFSPTHDALAKAWINAMDGTGTFVNVGAVEPR